MTVLLTKRAVVEVILLATSGLSLVGLMALMRCSMVLLSNCGDIYYHISELSTDLCLETLVTGYSFGIISCLIYS